MRLIACIAGVLILSLVAAPASAGLYDDFNTICRKTDASQGAAAAAARALGFGPAPEKDARDIAKEMPGAIALKRVQGKDEVTFVAGAKTEKGRILETCSLIANRAPASEARKLRAEFGRPTTSILGQQAYAYTRSSQGDTLIPKDAKRGQVRGEAKDVRMIVVGRMLGSTMLMLTKPRP